MNTDSDKAEKVVDVFDYVIVGAGPSAVGIIRGLLEEISKTETSSKSSRSTSLSIAIVERGHGPPHDSATFSPEQWYEAANPNTNSSKSVRLYPSEITGREMEIPVGQGLGGTSNINACLCLPPLQQDLKSWPDPYRSSLGPTAKYLRRVMEETKAIQHTLIENVPNPFSGKNSILDFGSAVPTMATRDVMTNKLVRRNYYDALVDPLLKNHPSLGKHLHWFRGYEAERLLMDGDSKHVRGIECSPTDSDHTTSTQYREIHANKRVLLCAGAIETPALLLVSSLGDKEPLLGVGQHLMDQALLARVYIKALSLRSETKSTNGIAALGHLRIKRDDCDKEGQIFQVAIADSVAHASIIPSVMPMALRWKCRRKMLAGIVEIVFRCIKSILRLAILYTPLGLILRGLTTTTMIFLMHPRSRGSVTVSLKKDRRPKTTRPKRRRDVTIEVDPKYMNDPQDMKDIKNAWDAIGRISGTSLEIFPSRAFSEFWFESYCRCFLLPYYHFSGTCAIIPRNDKDNPNWVVDASLKVRGHDGLHICDASVFPAMISNPPALTCAALGYEFARFIFVEDKYNITNQ